MIDAAYNVISNLMGVFDIIMIIGLVTNFWAHRFKPHIVGQSNYVAAVCGSIIVGMGGWIVCIFTLITLWCLK